MCMTSAVCFLKILDEITEDYWRLLETTGDYWRLLGITWNSWRKCVMLVTSHENCPEYFHTWTDERFAAKKVISLDAWHHIRKGERIKQMSLIIEFAYRSNVAPAEIKTTHNIPTGQNSSCKSDWSASHECK